MGTWWICRKFLYPIGREAILVSMLMFCLRNPIFCFQNDRKIGADWTSQSSFSLYPCSSNEGFEYIFLQIRLDFYLCSAKRGINLSRTKNRSAEKTLFLSARRSEEVCPKDEQTLENGMYTCRHSLFPLYLMSFRCQKRHVKLTRKRRPMLARPLLFYGCPALRQDKKKRKIPGGWQAASPLTHENRVFSKAPAPEAVRRILARRKLTKWKKDFYFMLWISKL